MMSQPVLANPFSWFGMLNLPDNVQSIAPVTNWGTQVTKVTYQGNPIIEQRVTEEVASFGKQLGVLSEAVLAIARLVEGAEQDPHVARLTEISGAIERVKEKSRQEVEQHMLEQMSFVAGLDDAEAEMLLARLAKVINDERRKKKKHPKA